MKKIIISAALSASFMFAHNVNAQSLAQEKVVELTGKSKNKGYLGDILVDDSKQQFEMVFVTKNNNRKVEYEVFQFDYDFNMVGKYSEEQRKIKAKGKKQAYRGKDYEEVVGVTAQGNLFGKLVLKKVLYGYSYNWWRGRYEINTTTLDKEKPKELSSDGDDKKRKLFYTSHREIQETGELLVCALVNKGTRYMYKEASREYLIMHIDNNLNTKNKIPLNFDHPQALLYTAVIEETNEWVMVFAPFGGQGYNKIADSNPTNLTMVKINQNGEIVERTNFNSKCNEWAIFDAYYANGDLYLYGAGNINKPEKKYTKVPFCISTDAIPGQGTPEQRQETLENMKFDYLQVIKISNGKAEFVSAVSIDEINQNGIKPNSQKKLRDFDGKKFVLNGFNVTSNGDLFISGQDFKIDNQGEVRGRVYKDMLMFHFDKDGNFKRYYGVENTAKSAGLFGGAGGAKSFPAEFTMYETPDGSSLYWNVFLCKDVDKDCTTETGLYSTTTTCVYTPLYQGMIGKINIEDGNISEFKTFGGEDFYLYIDVLDTPYFSINGGKEIIYIGRERKGGLSGNERWGNAIWFGKFDPTKN